MIAGGRIIVTGGASGLGAEIARVLAEAGGKVIIADVQAEAAERLAGEIGGEA
ncbi:MAG: SDR family NAD(P)-dependent oxidoreductase, partial [Sphingomonas sp.]|nr:SDR family NAD(P)-dependent oxidoreductase [Sphingomonas sp.]